MQDFLTQATVVAELFGFGYVAGSFAFYTHNRLKTEPRSKMPTRWQSIDFSVSPKGMTDAVRTTFDRKRSPVELLRQECQKAGIKWRNAHGKNKHLKKAEMIAALDQLERSRQKTQGQTKSANSQKPANSQKKVA